MKNTLAFAPICDLNDANQGTVQHVTLPFQDYGKRTSFAGRIRTCVTMEDTKLMQEALFGTPGEGGIIVIDGGGSMRTALLGDIQAARLHANGWAGIVINGPVRDIEALRDIDICIKALGVSPVRSAKRGIGALDVPVAFGNVLFDSGKCIYGDPDGVLVSDTPLFATPPG